MPTDTENSREEKQRRQRKEYYLRHRERIRANHRRWYAGNKSKTNATSLEWRKSNLSRIMLSDARKRATKMGFEFDLSLDDIEIPECCPVLGLFLQYGEGKRTDASPSLDRFDPKKGYTKTNIRVISWRANDLKKNATVDEIRLLLKYMEDAK